MKSKELFFNFNLIKEDLKRFWPISLIYFLAMFAVKPLHILSIFANEEQEYYNEYYLTRGSYETESIIILCGSILLSIILFNYLQSKKSSGMIHALPFTRKQLFNSHIFSGVVLLLTPLILNTIVLFIIYFTLDLSKVPQWFVTAFSHQKIMIDLLYSSLSSITIFLIGAFAGIISGTTFMHVLFSAVFPFLPIGLLGFSGLLLEKFVFGFRTSFYLGNNMLEQYIIPLVSVMNSSDFSFKLPIFYLFVCIIMYFLGYILYNKRNLENASDPIVFSGLKQVFKYGVAFCAMSIVGIYLTELFYRSTHQTFWLYFGMILGSLLGYIISEMLIEKTIWIFHKLKGYGIYVGIILIIGIIIKIDLLGYEKRIPNTDKIQGAVYGMPYSYYQDHDINTFITDKEDITKIQNIHKRIILDKNQIVKTKAENLESISVEIAYILKTGKTVVRNYDVPKDYLIEDINQKQLIESEQYKKMQYSKIFSTNSGEIDKIYFNINMTNKNLTIVDPKEIKEFFDILKQEILDSSYEELTSNASSWSYMNFVLKEQGKNTDPYSRPMEIHTDFKKHYTKLENWLSEKGYLQNARIMAEDIEKIVINELKTPVKNILQFENHPEMQPEVLNTWEIKDKEQIEEILRSYLRSPGNEKQKYMVQIYIFGQEAEYGYYNKDNLPNFIK